MNTDQRIEFTIPGTKRKVIIIHADLLKQDGLSIVHCPIQFDTHEDVIVASSLIGQMVKLAEGEREAFENQIDQVCRDKAGIATIDPQLPHRQYKFPKGTLCPVKLNGKDYYLVAFNESNSSSNIRPLSVAEYVEFWTNVWQNLSLAGNNGNVINVPVPGGKNALIDHELFDIDQRIGVILTTFFQSNCAIKYRQLRICLWGQDAEDVDPDNWQNTLLPFLYNMVKIGIWTTSAPMQVFQRGNGTSSEEAVQALPKPVVYDYEGFKTDLGTLMATLEQSNYMQITQKDGHRPELINIRLEIDAIHNFLHSLFGHEKLMNYLCEAPKGDAYDKNKLIQLLAFIEADTTFLGKLNKKSFARLIFGLSPDIPEGKIEMPERWKKLGKWDNVYTYLGTQYKRLTGPQKKHYASLLTLVPTEHRK